MNGPRDEFLAGAGFAGDEDRRIAAGDLGHSRQDRGERGRAADNLFEHRGLVDFLSQRHVFLLQSLFSSLAVFDISSGNIPTRNLPLFVVQGVVTSQKPAVTSIALAKPYFAFKSRAHRHSTIPLSLDPFRIIGMTDSANGGFVTPVIKSEAEVVKSTAVHEKTLAVASETSDELWCEVQNLPKLLFALAQRFGQLRQVEFRLPALLNIEVDPDPILQRSIGRAERLGTAEEPAVIALGVANANIHVTRRARLQIIRRDPARLFVIVRMQKGDMRVP